MEFPKLQWKENNIEANLTELANYAITNAQEFKDYYKKNSAYKKKWAKFLRVTAILSAAFGGLLPILSQIFSKSDKTHLDPAWATVAISLAITAIGLDRFFGFSSAWMRFVTTEIKIESKIEQFQINIENEKFSWVGITPDFDKAKSMLSLIVLFINEISDVVKDETNTWMVEFQNVLQKFNDEVNAKAENTKLGGVSIVFENGEKFKDGLKIHLEGQEPIIFKGSNYSFNNLYPKIYKLTVKGLFYEDLLDNTNTREVQTESLINVTPGNVAQTTIQLK